MNRNSIISTLALVISVIALCLVLNKQRLDQQAVDLAAEKALQKREKQLVNKVRDRFYTMYEGQGIGITKDWDPQNLEELSSPLMKMINALD